MRASATMTIAVASASRLFMPATAGGASHHRQPPQLVVDAKRHRHRPPRLPLRQRRRRRRQHAVSDFGRVMTTTRGGNSDVRISCNDDDNDAQPPCFREKIIDGGTNNGNRGKVHVPVANENNNGAHDSILLFRGGGGNKLAGNNDTNGAKHEQNINNDSSSSRSRSDTTNRIPSTLPTSLLSSPRTLAALSMATCMSLHYLAYSLARPATMTLFTSPRLGFGGEGGGSVSSAYPLAMTLIGPASFALLLLYGIALDARGPYGALQFTTLGCASVLGLSSLVIARMDATIPQHGAVPASAASTAMTRYIVGALFVFRESYVQLLTSQHWSFISSILTPSESSRWFAPISGLTSITSALAAAGVGKMSSLLGLQGVLLVASIVLGGSVVFGRMAYSIAEKNGFNPAEEQRRKRQKHQAQSSSADGNALKTSSSSERRHDKNYRSKDGIFSKAGDVFRREPTLWALFCEILACQGLSTLLNVCCITRVSEAMPDDAERAGWMGKFFAAINVLSCILQFGVLPATSSYFEPGTLWRGMPLLMLAMTLPLAFPKFFGGGRRDSTADPSLDMVASAFLVMKTLEFSVRRMLDEMVYVPLDYESRFLGKEVIGVLGYRFGKSAASLALSGLTSLFGAVGLRELSYLTTGAAGVWLGAVWRLSNLVPTREQAEEAYKKMKTNA